MLRNLTEILLTGWGLVLTGTALIITRHIRNRPNQALTLTDTTIKHHLRPHTTGVHNTCVSERHHQLDTAPDRARPHTTISITQCRH